MIHIPGGRLAMGTEDPRTELERPRHEIDLTALWLGETEVTQAEYAQFLRRHPDMTAPRSWPARDAFPPGLATMPVVEVEWDDAMAYCRWAYPNGGRLPTEEEWEWAARGAAGREFVWGDAFDEAAANYGPKSRGVLTPVGSFPAGKSPEGVHDLAGNAYEWTASEMRRYDGAPVGELRGRRVIRGGSFRSTLVGDSDVALRAWYRNYDVPARRSETIGFRCAWSPAR
jgi:formylglycine-generating enzyme required for sulfatase activity